MNFGRNFAKFGDFGHVRNFLTNEIQNPGPHTFPQAKLVLELLFFDSVTSSTPFSRPRRRLRGNGLHEKTKLPPFFSNLPPLSPGRWPALLAVAVRWEASPHRPLPSSAEPEAGRNPRLSSSLRVA